MPVDLTENKIPFGLLSAEEQEHLMTWPHGLLILSPTVEGRLVWKPRAKPTAQLNATSTYRTIPAPVEPEREIIWVHLDEKRNPCSCKNLSDAKTILGGMSGFAFRIEFDATTGDNPTIVKEAFDEI